MVDRLNPHVRATDPPAIVELGPRVREARAKRGDLIDLGQAVPRHGPPEAVLRELATRLADGAAEVHRYSHDEGRPSLRARWANEMRARLGVHVDPERELMITAGANQAYLMAVMTVLSPGDEMGVISPLYFNHTMAIEMIGCRVHEIPLAPEDGYQLDPDRVIGEVRRRRLKALTLVTPSNPSGVTYREEDLRRVTEALIDDGVFVLVDETYALFAEPEHWSPARAEGNPRHVITIGSFSKAFAITGWRAGYVAASREVIEEMLKVQDTMVICASHPAQLLVEIALEQAWSWLDERKKELASRARLLRARQGELAPWTLDSSGLFFALLRGPFGGRALWARLLDEAGVIVLPGEPFGRGLEHTVRVGVGCADEASLSLAIDRLATFFRRAGT